MDASSLADVGILAARVCLSVVYLWSGVAKLVDRPAGIAEVKALHLPMPGLCLGLTIACQLVAGLMVLLGLGTRLGALALLGFTVVATLAGHPFWRLAGAERVQQRMIALEHLAIVGGFILLVVHGGGALSLDRWLH
jgi:putative oxidoreductase